MDFIGIAKKKLGNFLHTRFVFLQLEKPSFYISTCDLIILDAEIKKAIKQGSSTTK